MKIYRCIKNFQANYEKYKQGDILVVPKGYDRGLIYRDYGHAMGRVTEWFVYTSHLSKFELVFVVPPSGRGSTLLSASVRDCVSILNQNNKLISKTLLKEIAEVASA